MDHLTPSLDLPDQRTYARRDRISAPAPLERPGADTGRYPDAT